LQVTGLGGGQGVGVCTSFLNPEFGCQAPKLKTKSKEPHVVRAQPLASSVTWAPSSVASIFLTYKMGITMEPYQRVVLRTRGLDDTN
jgi:hypothetical protein